jgi:hypothetical protein
VSDYKSTYASRGRTYRIRVAEGPYLSGDGLSDEGRRYVEGLLSRLDEARAFATRQLLETYNDSWIDDDHPELNDAEFAAKLQDPTVSLSDEAGNATVYFQDGDMFGGHVVAVSFRELDPYRADIMG